MEEIRKLDNKKRYSSNFTKEFINKVVHDVEPKYDWKCLFWNIINYLF